MSVPVVSCHTHRQPPSLVALAIRGSPSFQRLWQGDMSDVPSLALVMAALFDKDLHIEDSGWIRPSLVKPSTEKAQGISGWVSMWWRTRPSPGG